MKIRCQSFASQASFMPSPISRRRQILFVGQCNDALSQMAEAFAVVLLGPLGIQVASGGLTPTGVRPWAVQVMAEIGIDITRHVSKSVVGFEPGAIDTLVLVEPGLAIPSVFRPLRRVEWALDAGRAEAPLADPKLDLQRRLRDRVEAAVLRLIAVGATGRRRHAVVAAPTKH
jgi:arsenate reductase